MMKKKKKSKNESNKTEQYYSKIIKFHRPSERKKIVCSGCILNIYKLNEYLLISPTEMKTVNINLLSIANSFARWYVMRRQTAMVLNVDAVAIAENRAEATKVTATAKHRLREEKNYLSLGKRNTEYIKWKRCTYTTNPMLIHDKVTKNQWVPS